MSDSTTPGNRDLADYQATKNRTAYQLGLRIVRDSQVPIKRTQLRGVGDAFAIGAILTEAEGNYAAGLASPIDANAAGPVSFIAETAYTGGDNEQVAAQTIRSSTRLVGQVSTGTVSQDDVGRQGRIVGSATTGLYAVDLSDTAAPSIQVTSVEPLDYPWEPGANGTRNLVEFKFLDTVLAIAPPSVGS